MLWLLPAPTADSEFSILLFHSFRTQYATCWGFPVGSEVKNSLAIQRCRRRRLNPWVGKIPRRRAWQPIPVFLPGKSQEQWSLEGTTVHGVTKCQIWSKSMSTHAHRHVLLVHMMKWFTEVCITCFKRYESEQDRELLQSLQTHNYQLENIKSKNELHSFRKGREYYSLKWEERSLERCHVSWTLGVGRIW